MKMIVIALSLFGLSSAIHLERVDTEKHQPLMTPSCANICRLKKCPCGEPSVSLACKERKNASPENANALTPIGLFHARNNASLKVATADQDRYHSSVSRPVRVEDATVKAAKCHPPVQKNAEMSAEVIVDFAS